MGTVRRINIDQNDTRGGTRKLKQNPFDAVGRPDAGAVAGRETQPLERSSGRRDIVEKLQPRVPAVLMPDHQRLVAPKSFSSLFEKL